MGTLAATLTLSDSTTFSDAINFSVTDSLTTTAPAQGLTIQTITTADNQELVDEGTSLECFTFLQETLIQLTLLYFKQQLVNNMLD